MKCFIKTDLLAIIKYQVSLPTSLFLPEPMNIASALQVSYISSLTISFLVFFFFYVLYLEMYFCLKNKNKQKTLTWVMFPKSFHFLVSKE